MSKPDAQIIDETEAIARIILNEAGLDVPADYKCHEHRDILHIDIAWNAAARIMDEVFDCCVETALANEGID